MKIFTRLILISILSFVCIIGLYLGWIQIILPYFEEKNAINAAEKVRIGEMDAQTAKNRERFQLYRYKVIESKVDQYLEEYLQKAQSYSGESLSDFSGIEDKYTNPYYSINIPMRIAEGAKIYLKNEYYSPNRDCSLLKNNLDIVGANILEAYIFTPTGESRKGVLFSDKNWCNGITWMKIRFPGLENDIEKYLAARTFLLAQKIFIQSIKDFPEDYSYSID